MTGIFPGWDPGGISPHWRDLGEILARSRLPPGFAAGSRRDPGDFFTRDDIERRNKRTAKNLELGKSLKKERMFLSTYRRVSENLGLQYHKKKHT